MPDRRYLVLGASGFIGRHLCRCLSATGENVRAFSRGQPVESHYVNLSRVRWIEGDFLDESRLRSALAGCEVVYHLISTTTPGTSNQSPLRDVRENVVGTVQLLELMRELHVPKIVFVSTGGAIYGDQVETPIREESPTEPISAYGIGKLAVEKYLALYQRIAGISHCILRVANVYGEGQPLDHGQGAVGIFLAKAMRGEMIDIWGDGSVIRDFVYIGDVVRALTLAADYAGSQRLFNIGSGQGRSLNELLVTLESELGQPIRRRYLPRRTADVAINVLDITRARRELGWAIG